MSKRKFLAIAIEDSLATEKMLKSSEVAASGSDFGALRDTLSSKIDTMIDQRDNPVEPSADYGSDGNDDSGADNSSGASDSSDDSFDFGDEGSSGTEDLDDSGDTNDTSAEETVEQSDKKDKEKDSSEKTDKDSTEEKNKEATERASLYIANTEESLTKEFRLIDASISKEETTLGEGVWEGVKALGAVAYSVGNALAYVGVNIAWPGLRHLYKGVLYLSAKFIRYSYAGVTKIDSQVESFSNRLSKTKLELESAKEVVALLKKKQSEFPDSVPDKVINTFDRNKVISRIKLGKVFDPVENSAVIQAFLSKWYGKVSKDIEKDSAAIKQVLYYGTQTALNPVKTFGDSSMRNGLVPDKNNTNTDDNSFVSDLRYSDSLPGSLYYHCTVPNGTAKSLDEIRLAYAASSASFAIDTATFIKLDRIDYMDLNGVEKSINAVEGLIKTLEKQKDIYTSIKNEKVMYLNSFKRYLYKLADESERINIEKSMLEYIYLRGLYIDNVYVVTARDIHEYTHRYLANVMIYLRSNLEELSS